MSPPPAITPSPYRNPAASSKSATGVSMMTATLAVALPTTRRISSGSSVAR
jgi:hypothetical protein